MRIVLVWIVLTTLNCTRALPPVEVGTDHKHESDESIHREKRLSVSARIVKQSYCHNDDEVVSIRMQVALRFTNTSENPVILAKLIESPPIVRAAMNAESAERADFESDPIFDFFPTKLPDAPQFGKSPDPKYFVVLAPQETYETTVDSGVFGWTGASQARKESGLLPKGDHVVQFGVGVWPYDWPYFARHITSDQLSKKWRKYGYLAHGFAYTNFVPFTIPEHFDNPFCDAAKAKR